MKCILSHSEPDGGETRVVCYGQNEEELNADIDFTMKRLNWSKKYCYIAEEGEE